MADYSGMRALEVWYETIGVEEVQRIERAFAELVLAAIPSELARGLLYARVDLVRDAGSAAA